MPDDLGADTRDILALGGTHPAEQHLNPDDREDRTRRFGRRCITAGLTTYFLTIVGTFGLAMATDGPTFGNMTASCFGLLAFMTTMSLGSILIAAGAAERNQRSQRAMMRQAIGLVRDNARRNDRIEHAIDRIAEQLPEDQQLRHWRGFNEAVREGFTTQQTGTDGSGTVRKRLGVVPPPRPDRSN